MHEYSTRKLKFNTLPFPLFPSFSTQEEKLPVVLLGIFIEKPIPFMEEFFIKIQHMDYPKKKIHLFVHNDVSRQAYRIYVYV